VNATAPALTRKHRVLEDDTIFAAQRHHFLLFDVLPLCAFLASLPILWRIGVGTTDVVLFLVLWVANLIGIEVGFHRLFSHGAFQTTPAVKAVLVVLGSMGAQGPVISWASNHRHHHQHSDGPHDSHTPHQHGPGRFSAVRGFFHAHLGWKYRYPYPSPSHYTPALVRDRTVLRTSRHYYGWILLGLLVPALFGGLFSLSLRGALASLLLGGVARLFLGQHATWCVNSVCHVWGRRPFATGDQSTNNAWFALPTLGGSWHNNHHAFPTTAHNGLLPGQIDPCYWFIRALARVGLAWDVKVPSPALIQTKLAATPSR
jgi:stearoyl-CoA desaturase (delta-9 desaturase)